MLRYKCHFIDCAVHGDWTKLVKLPAIKCQFIHSIYSRFHAIDFTSLQAELLSDLALHKLEIED